MNNTSKEDLRTTVEKMHPQLRQNLAQKDIDPVMYHFRMVATREFRRWEQMGPV